MNIAPTSPLYWMNAAEVAFLRAEGQAVFNFSMGGTAESFYNQGIRLSFEQWGADGVEDYLKDDVKQTDCIYRPGRYEHLSECFCPISLLNGMIVLTKKRSKNALSCRSGLPTGNWVMKLRQTSAVPDIETDPGERK